MGLKIRAEHSLRSAGVKLHDKALVFIVFLSILEQRKGASQLVELFRTNDPVLISYIVAVLKDEGIEAVVLDEHTSILEGSIGAIQRRVVVSPEDESAARVVLEDVAPGELKD